MGLVASFGSADLKSVGELPSVLRCFFLMNDMLRNPPTSCVCFCRNANPCEVRMVSLSICMRV
jgi:hypothetical protein